MRAERVRGEAAADRDAAAPAAAEAVVEALPDGKGCVVRLGDRTVRVPARCPHRGAPLAAALVTGTFLECPWHGATFDLRTGHRVRGPHCADLAVRPVPADGTANEEEGST
ncbi:MULTISPECIES: Rieske (2Fe-2S) protein [Streptomyces]|uniref:Rieske (2Fe-2S) protein n=1 Tax=Streptomyces TaxID=1883 RepID=UPI00163C31AA|nr:MULTISPECIES: Rieske 2Fe-2S domain-containing protein [Streptomyces]MBC2875416.1 Rieske 2Fe-2S domain-containing protein [Streptomyces sp. TYQ1024]UBI35658.1 Rieske 2Fe-2S domain-containing protein [Streptomyces mobaraensis]UKW28251.1 Rieske 2Fe-2S domain-containing protein [Streptomyces sp. TYQ1024]